MSSHHKREFAGNMTHKKGGCQEKSRQIESQLQNKLWMILKAYMSCEIHILIDSLISRGFVLKFGLMLETSNALTFREREIRRF